jgi:hypothetical protein
MSHVSKSHMQTQAHRRPISSGKTSKTEVGPCDKRPVSIWPSGEQLTPATVRVNSQKLAVGKSPPIFWSFCRSDGAGIPRIGWCAAGAGRSITLHMYSTGMQAGCTVARLHLGTGMCSALDDPHSIYGACIRIAWTRQPPINLLICLFSSHWIRDHEGATLMLLYMDCFRPSIGAPLKVKCGPSGPCVPDPSTPTPVSLPWSRDPGLRDGDDL